MYIYILSRRPAQPTQPCRWVGGGRPIVWPEASRAQERPFSFSPSPEGGSPERGDLEASKPLR